MNNAQGLPYLGTVETGQNFFGQKIYLLGHVFVVQLFQILPLDTPGHKASLNNSSAPIFWSSIGLLRKFFGVVQYYSEQLHNRITFRIRIFFQKRFSPTIRVLG